MMTKAQKKHRKELKRKKVRRLKNEKLQYNIHRSSIGKLRKDPDRLSLALIVKRDRLQKRQEREKLKNELGTKI